MRWQSTIIVEFQVIFLWLQSKVRFRTWILHEWVDQFFLNSTHTDFRTSQLLQTQRCVWFVLVALLFILNFRKTCDVNRKHYSIFWHSFLIRSPLDEFRSSFFSLLEEYQENFHQIYSFSWSKYFLQIDRKSTTLSVTTCIFLYKTILGGNYGLF